MTKRFFNRKQKAAMYIVNDGKCAICGVELDVGWHADHVEAWSEGGETDVINGQPLCPDCNLKKGSKNNMILPTWTKPLREWQHFALERYQQHPKPDFLLVATPGAGKTNFALRVAHYLLQSELVSQIIVVCPTVHLKTQWTEEAYRAGIELNPNHDVASPTMIRGFKELQQLISKLL